MSDQKKIDLSGCTYNDLSIEEHLARKPCKETEEVYTQEIAGKKNPNPIYSTPKYKQPKERSGPVKTITQTHQNKYVSKNFSQCKNLRQVILTLLLTGNKYNARKILSCIEYEIPNNTNLRKIFKHKKLDIKTIWNTMGIILRTQVKSLINIEIEKNPKSKPARIYSLNEKGTNLTLEEISKLAVHEYIPNIKRRKTKEAEKPKVDKQKLLDIVNKMLSHMVDKKEYKSTINALLAQIQSLEQNIPSSTSNLKIKVSGGIDINFSFNNS